MANGKTRRAGQLIQRGERSFLVRIYLGRDADGKRKYHAKTIQGTKKEAQAYLNRILREQDLGTFVEPSKMTLDEYLDSWLATAASQRVRKRTFTSYGEILASYVRPYLGSRQLGALTPLEIQSAYTKLQERGLSARTVRYAHSVLRSALEQAVKWRLLAHNPVQNVDLPRQTRTEFTALSPEQARRFLADASESPYGVLFEILLVTGLRPGEALGLKWSDVDLDVGRVKVQRVLVRGRQRNQSLLGWWFEEPKTPRARRTVPIPASTVQALRTHRRRQLEHRLARRTGYEDLGLVFCADDGQPLRHRDVVRYYFKPLLQKAGLPETTRLYDLRHSCATLLLSAGENPKVVSERLGHASITLTLDTYSHVLPDMQEGAAAKLESMLYAWVR